jgi:hypothetical protein
MSSGQITKKIIVGKPKEFIHLESPSSFTQRADWLPFGCQNVVLNNTAKDQL